MRDAAAEMDAAGVPVFTNKPAHAWGRHSESNFGDGTAWQAERQRWPRGSGCRRGDEIRQYDCGRERHLKRQRPWQGR
jgi:hypothetical protein